jgi:hypothetical protein
MQSNIEITGEAKIKTGDTLLLLTEIVRADDEFALLQETLDIYFKLLEQ